MVGFIMFLGVVSIVIGIILIVTIIGAFFGIGVIINGIMLIAFSSVLKTVKENNEYLRMLNQSKGPEIKQVNPSIAKPKEEETVQEKSETKGRKCPQCGYELGEENPSMCPKCKAFLPQYK